MSADPPYPEIKKTHTMAHTGRPWRDFKPPPAAPVWAVIQGYGSYWTLVAALDLGVFDAIEALGPTPVEPLATRLEVSAPHLRHLLDALVTSDFLDQVDDRYELTDTAERYLCTDGAASMAALVRVAPGPLENWTELARTVRTGRVPTPIETAPAAFYGPLVEATFTTQYRAATRLGVKLGWARRPRLRVLDLGAGGAPWTIAVLEQSEDATSVVNDWPDVLGVARRKVEERSFTARVDFVEGDFHTAYFGDEPFDLVVVGHLLRTEGAQGARRLLERAYAALRPGGELVVADYFADNERKHNPFGVQMGLTMLANTERGGLITNADACDWMHGVGFEGLRLLEPIGFNFCYVAYRPERSTP